MRGLKSTIFREVRLVTGIVILGLLLFFTGRYFKDQAKDRTYFSIARADMDKLLKDHKDPSTITTRELMNISGITQSRLSLIDRHWKKDQIKIAFFDALRVFGFVILILGYPFCVVIKLIFNRQRIAASSRR
jgi:hypothetical protein